MNNAAQQTSTPVAAQPPEKKAKTSMSHLLQSINEGYLKGAVATEIVDLLNEQQMNMILAKIIDRKQKESNDKDVITYTNIGNRKMIKYLKIPYCKMEGVETFLSRKNNYWVDRAVEISVTTGNKDKDRFINLPAALHASAKRMTKKLMKEYPDATKEAIVELNMVPEDKKMSALKIASMFKAAQVDSFSKRRLLLRHLRHHFGKHAFDTESNITKIWDGHSDPHPEMVTWTAKVNGDATRGPRKSEEAKAIEEERKLERQMEIQRQRADGMLHSHQRDLDGMM